MTQLQRSMCAAKIIYNHAAQFMNVLTVTKKPNVDIATWASENSHVDLARTT